MADINIFTEGKSDIRFLKNFIEHIIKNINKFEFINIGGWKGIEKILNELKKNTFDGIKNVLILDADTESNGGGFQKRKKEVKDTIGNDIQYDLFLFPNNKDDGDLETLLEKIINPNHKGLLECFENYEDCITSKDSIYETPNTKAKMYAYISSFKLSSEERKDLSKDWLFSNSEYWNLNSKKLYPLENFLCSLLS